MINTKMVISLIQDQLKNRSTIMPYLDGEFGIPKLRYIRNICDAHNFEVVHCIFGSHQPYGLSDPIVNSIDGHLAVEYKTSSKLISDADKLSECGKPTVIFLDAIHHAECHPAGYGLIDLFDKSISLGNIAIVLSGDLSSTVNGMFSQYIINRCAVLPINQYDDVCHQQIRT